MSQAVSLAIKTTSLIDSNHYLYLGGITMKRVLYEIAAYIISMLSALGGFCITYIIAESTNVWKIFGVALFIIPSILFYEIMSIDEYYHKKGH